LVLLVTEWFDVESEFQSLSKDAWSNVSLVDCQRVLILKIDLHRCDKAVQYHSSPQCSNSSIHNVPQFYLKCRQNELYRSQEQPHNEQNCGFGVSMHS